MEKYKLDKLQKASFLMSSAQVNNSIVNPNTLKPEIFDKMSFDFFFPSQSVGILFLSLEYHYEYPIYINARLSELIKSLEYKETLTCMICVVCDREDSSDYLVDLQIYALLEGVQTMVFNSGKHFHYFLKNLAKQYGKHSEYVFLKAN